MAEHDPAAFNDWLRKLGAAGMGRVLNTLIADAPRLAGVLRDSAQRGDAGAVQRAAHSMKTPCGMFGAGDLARLCQELEDQGAAGAIPDAVQRADKIAERYEHLAQELHTALTATSAAVARPA